MQLVNNIMNQLTLLGLPCNQHVHQLTNIGIHDTTMILSRSHKDQPTSFIIEPGLLLSRLSLLFAHSVTYSELGPYPRAWLSIDLNTHSAEVSTLYPHHGTQGLALPFGWTNGVPINPIYCHDTLPATPTNCLSGLMGRPMPTKGIFGHRRGKTVPNGDMVYQSQQRSHKAYAVLPDQGSPTHNLPSLEAPTRGMKINPVRTPPP